MAERVGLNGAQAELFAEAVAAHSAAQLELDKTETALKRLVRAFGYSNATLVGFDTETRELLLNPPELGEPAQLESQAPSLAEEP